MASEAPKPVIDIGRVVSRGFGALKGNFIPFFIAALLCSGVPTFLQQYTYFTGIEAIRTGAGSLFVLDPMFWGSALASIAGYFALQGFVTRSSILTMMGKTPDHGDSALLALRLILPLFGLAIITGLAVIVGFILLIVPAFMVMTALLVAGPALVEERRGVYASIERSRDLTRGSRWLVFLLLILFYVVSIIVSTLLNTIAGVNPVNMILGDVASLPSPWIAAGASALASSLVGAFNTVMVAALYVELRTVKEGASTEELSGIFE